MDNIESFQKSVLKTVETVVKTSLPDQDIVAQEKEIIEAETEQNKEVFGKGDLYMKGIGGSQSTYFLLFTNII